MATTMPLTTQSPPPTPSPPRNKRPYAELNLGENSLARPPKAQRIYYGINIHQLLDEARAEENIPKAALDLPTPPVELASSPRSNLLWTEKYRARKFTDLIGDERTHRAVMHWLKRWDAIVFPGSQRPPAKTKSSNDRADERPHRKLLMLTGPPGLGKTTLAHVCARQAGYEVQEINASDERSSAVVRGRIRDMVGTENVRGRGGKTAEGVVRKAGKPVCVIIDEVDGVVSGSGGSGEGGFVKALIDLVMLDQKNSTALGTLQQGPARKKTKGDRFRLLRPMILICNDVYHPALRPLRQSAHAEVIHVRKAPVQSLVPRLHSIFDGEGVPCDIDGVRRLCEATWGVSNRREDRSGSGSGEGDMRGILVVGEWVAGKLRSLRDTTGTARLTRRWVEEHILSDLAHGGGAARALGRGGPKDIVERVFQEGAGFPKSTIVTTATSQQHQFSSTTGPKGVAEGIKRTAGERLRELLETHGDTDRIMTDCFSAYPERPFQDDTFLSKPDAAYDWLHFHDTLSSAVFSSNEWELAPYLSTPILAFHHLFASSSRAQNSTTTTEDPNDDTLAPHPFTGTQASWAAHEAQKHNDALLHTLHSSLATDLSRAFSSPSALATDLLPYLLHMLSPAVNPIVVGGSNSESGTAAVRKASEQVLVQRAVQAMAASGVRFERTRVTGGGEDAGPASFASSSQWIYRMEPALDAFGMFETGGKGFGGVGGASRTRYAVRQVLEQEWRKEEKRRAEVARMARFRGGPRNQVAMAEDGEVGAATERKMQNATLPSIAIKRDFFGRPVATPASGDLRAKEGDGVPGEEDERKKRKTKHDEPEGRRVWVTFHEGYSNAVRKPITLAELMRDL